MLCVDADYGIAAQRKVDLAARRIGKLITFTQVNDRLREEVSCRNQLLALCVVTLLIEFVIQVTATSMADCYLAWLAALLAARSTSSVRSRCATASPKS